jgi:hypothetical protein
MNPADRYRRVLEKLAVPSLRETAPRGAGLSELALQARIYAGEFGLCWRGEDGETVEVVHFGAWNREPGPDFCGAKVIVDGVEKTGEIEVDPDVRDWENHGHARNENYNTVVLHLFFRRGPRRFFTRTAENRVVVQVCLDTPGGVMRAPAAPDSPLEEDAARQLIEAAAQFRFRRKAERFQRSQLLCGREEALFQAIATGLGYKNNKIPFLLVAQRAGLGRAAAREGEALLFGLAGFLRAEDFASGDDEARNYLRDLWENWWAIRDGEARLVLDEAAWKFSAVRPANHPHRRMGALAAVSRSFRRIARSSDPADFVRVLTSLEHSFWSVHYNLACERLPRPAALIGIDRARELVINALLPSFAVERAWEILKDLEGPSPSSRVRKALAWICGCEPPHFLRRAMPQQGLLQMYEDFFPRGAGEIWAEYSRGPALPLGD